MGSVLIDIISYRYKLGQIFYDGGVCDSRSNGVRKLAGGKHDVDLLLPSGGRDLHPLDLDIGILFSLDHTGLILVGPLGQGMTDDSDGKGLLLLYNGESFRVEISLHLSAVGIHCLLGGFRLRRFASPAAAGEQHGTRQRQSQRSCKYVSFFHTISPLILCLWPGRTCRKQAAG